MLLSIVVYFRRFFRLKPAINGFIAAGSSAFVFSLVLPLRNDVLFRVKI